MKLKRLITASTALALLLSSGCMGPGNFATCILDRMPSVRNDAAAHAVMQLCKQATIGGYSTIEQGSGRGWLGHASGSACTIKKAAKTTSQRAGRMIYRACSCLYDEAEHDGQTCAERQGLTVTNQ